MNSKHIRGDLNLAWPTAEIAVMGPKGAVEILFRKEIAEADDPEGRPTPGSPSTARCSRTRTWRRPAGFVDDVIDPRETRERLISGLDMLRNKRDRNPPSKHGNIPL
jgi:propionyl-CoA carboxylase beta chain